MIVAQLIDHHCHIELAIRSPKFVSREKVYEVYKKRQRRKEGRVKILTERSILKCILLIEARIQLKGGNHEYIRFQFIHFFRLFVSSFK